MALKAEIYKVELELVDMDRNRYESHRLTLACHPSETTERMMLRLLAWGLNAEEGLAFGKGVSDSDEPDLWLKDYEGRIKLWIELGHPDEKLLARAIGRSERVLVYAYSARPELWWDPLKARFSGEEKLTVRRVAPDSLKAMAALADRKMSLQLSVQDAEVWLRDDSGGEVRVENGTME